ncbi:class F sortase [Streptomyces sp. NPDC093094]|uniref:class F sortase n=1 Tax=Streptomyces sp. NPDC093094 TaxID=3366026 RepID=UPI00380A731E
MPDTGPALRFRRLQAVVIALLAVSGTAVLASVPSGGSLPRAAQFDARQPPASAPPVRTQDTGAATAPSARHPTGGDPRRLDPRRLDLRRLGVSAEIEPVGVAADGSAEIPEDPDRVGWYRYGPAPGEASGSAVIVGHVDSATGDLGAFASLYSVRADDVVTVRRTGGPPVTYQVVARTLADKEHLPASAFARTGRPVLTLITCAPPFDETRGGYQRNLIVTAVPR